MDNEDIADITQTNNNTDGDFQGNGDQKVVDVSIDTTACRNDEIHEACINIQTSRTEEILIPHENEEHILKDIETHVEFEDTKDDNLENGTVYIHNNEPVPYIYEGHDEITFNLDEGTMLEKRKETVPSSDIIKQPETLLEFNADLCENQNIKDNIKDEDNDEDMFMLMSNDMAASGKCDDRKSDFNHTVDLDKSETQGALITGEILSESDQKENSDGNEDGFSLCKPCTGNNIEMKAHSFCEKCQHNLCQMCTQYHHKVFSNKSHSVSLLSDGMNQMKIDQVQSPTETETHLIESEESCPVHKNNKIEYFCAWDLKLCCKTCVDTEHNKCKVSFIPVESENIESSQELGNIVDALTSVGQQFNSFIELMEKKRAVTKQCHDSSLREFRHFRDDMNKYLQTFEDNLNWEEGRIYRANNDKIDHLEVVFHRMFSEYKKIKERIEHKRANSKKSHLFISIKQAERAILQIQEQLSDRSNDLSSVISYRLNKPDLLKTIFERSGKQGDLLKLNDFESIACRSMEDKCILGMSFKETYAPRVAVAGIEKLPSEQLILTGWDGKKIFLFNLQSSKIVSRIQVSASPYDVTSVTTNKVAVTIPDDKKIQFVFVQTDTLILEEEIAVGDHCYGIAKTGTSFVVTFPKVVKIMDQSGNVLKEITAGVGGVELSNDPMYVAVDPDGLSMYLSDGKRSIITRMSMVDGMPMGFYMSNSLIKPKGIVVDENGFVYVCGQKSNNIHCLTPELTKGKIITGSDNSLGEPTCLSYSLTKRGIYVGLNGPLNKVIKVLNL